MRVRFSILACVDQDARLGLVGSCPELGSWDAQKCVPLAPCGRPQRTHLKATFWTAAVELPESAEVEYKYVLWQVNSTAAEVAPPVRTSTFGEVQQVEALGPDDLLFPDSGTPLLPPGGATVKWEGTGPCSNRKLLFTGGTRADDELPDSSSHFMNSEDELPCDGTYAIPPAHFRVPEGTSERDLTTRYYSYVKNKNGIEFDYVWPNVIVGTCPRDVSQIVSLKEDHNVGAVLCLQAPEDIEENFPLAESYPDRSTRTAHVLSELYRQHGLGFINIPTTDMCSDSRARMIADASYLLDGLLRGTGKRVYVHCNAGVGRAIAAASGYLRNIVGLPLRKVNLIICTRRPVAFFDHHAVRAGFFDFQRKYAGALAAP